MTVLPAIRRPLSLALLACALVACNRQGPQQPVAVETAAQQDRNPNGVDTVVVQPDAAFVGAAVDDRGDILTPQNQFAAGATVYVSVPTKGRRLGDRLEVFWFHDDGKSRKDESKKIAGPFTAFEFKPTDPGKYNVEVDANNRPIGLVEFELK